MTGRPILGIDLGGTKIGTGLVDQDGRCCTATASLPSVTRGLRP